jgi:hypothetical protein
LDAFFKKVERKKCQTPLNENDEEEGEEEMMDYKSDGESSDISKTKEEDSTDEIVQEKESVIGKSSPPNLSPVDPTIPSLSYTYKPQFELIRTENPGSPFKKVVIRSPASLKIKLRLSDINKPVDLDVDDSRSPKGIKEYRKIVPPPSRYMIIESESESELESVSSNFGKSQDIIGKSQDISLKIPEERQKIILEPSGLQQNYRYESPSPKKLPIFDYDEPVIEAKIMENDFDPLKNCKRLLPPQTASNFDFEREARNVKMELDTTSEYGKDRWKGSQKVMEQSPNPSILALDPILNCGSDVQPANSSEQVETRKTTVYIPFKPQNDLDAAALEEMQTPKNEEYHYTNMLVVASSNSGQSPIVCDSNVPMLTKLTGLPLPKMDYLEEIVKENEDSGNISAESIDPLLCVTPDDGKSSNMQSCEKAHLTPCYMSEPCELATLDNEEGMKASKEPEQSNNDVSAGTAEVSGLSFPNIIANTTTAAEEMLEIHPSVNPVDKSTIFENTLYLIPIVKEILGSESELSELSELEIHLCNTIISDYGLGYEASRVTSYRDQIAIESSHQKDETATKNIVDDTFFKNMLSKESEQHLKTTPKKNNIDCGTPALDIDTNHDEYWLDGGRRSISRNCKPRPNLTPPVSHLKEKLVAIPKTIGLVTQQSLVDEIQQPQNTTQLNTNVLSAAKPAVDKLSTNIFVPDWELQLKPSISHASSGNKSDDSKIQPSLIHDAQFGTNINCQVKVIESSNDDVVPEHDQILVPVKSSINDIPKNLKEIEQSIMYNQNKVDLSLAIQELEQEDEQEKENEMRVLITSTDVKNPKPIGKLTKSVSLPVPVTPDRKVCILRDTQLILSDSEANISPTSSLFSTPMKPAKRDYNKSPTNRSPVQVFSNQRIVKLNRDTKFPKSPLAKVSNLNNLDNLSSSPEPKFDLFQAQLQFPTHSNGIPIVQTAKSKKR